MYPTVVAVVSPAARPDLLLLQIALVLVLALVLGHACRRYLKVPVVGELAAGVLLGPSVTGSLPAAAQAWLNPATNADFASLAQVAVVLIVGVTGLHLDLGRLRHERRAVCRLAGFSLVVPAMLGLAAAALLPTSLRGAHANTTTFVVTVAIAAGVSALPVAAVTLRQAGLLHHRIGQLVLAAASVEDLLAWIVLSIVVATADGSGSRATTVALLAVCALLSAIAAGGRPMRAGLRRLACWGDGPEFAGFVGVMAAGAAFGAAAGLEPIVGAMMAGVLLSRCGPPGAAAGSALDMLVTWICTPLFLASAGAHLDVRTFTDTGVLSAALALVVVASAGKLLGGYLGARSGGLSHRLALVAGAALNARGMVEIVIASVGLRLGIFGAQMYSIIVFIALATSLSAPFALRLLGVGTDGAPVAAAGAAVEPAVP